MAKNSRLSASLEDYLEAIFHIVVEKSAARSKDISTRLGVSGSSVTEALRGLSERKLVHYAPYEVITLTPKGRKLAEDVVRRHGALRDFFVKVLGVELQEADSAACKMEHAIPAGILDKIIRFVDYLESHPLDKNRWLQELEEHDRSQSQEPDQHEKEPA